MIHLAGPVVLAAALAGAGVYGLLARRNAVLVLIGAELLLNAAAVLLVTASALPSTGLAGMLAADAARTSGTVPVGGSANAVRVVDPLVGGQVAAVMVVTIAAAEIGLALAVVLLVFRRRATSDLTAMTELGEASPTYDEHPDAGELRPPHPPDVAAPDVAAPDVAAPDVAAPDVAAPDVASPDVAAQDVAS